MDQKRIESLRLHIASVAMAAIGRKEGDLREATDDLLGEVERVVQDAMKALELIADIAESSTTVNSLAHIAKIARAALSAGCGTPGCNDPDCTYGKGPNRIGEQP